MGSETPTTARAAGDRLGPYELIRLLGTGGAGEVWEARLHGPGGFRKPVALKILRAQAVEGAEGLLREARLGALVQHPNVVGTLGVSEHDGVWTVALELVRGASTWALLRRLGPLPAAAVLDVGVQVASALEHIHELTVDGAAVGLVHRDIKPANVLVDQTGLVKLADLGISLLSGEPGATAGTPGFMPPEQRAGRADARADLFALGVSLFVLATGKRPFGSGDAAGERVEQVEALLQNPYFLGPLEAAVPGLGPVVGRALRRDPADRWPSAAALRDALAALRPRQADSPPLRELVARAQPVSNAPAAGGTGPSKSVGSGGSGGATPSAGTPPPGRDAFVGRADEQRELRALVLEGSLRTLTIVGSGGIGKSRLAAEVARSVGPRLAGGTLWVALAEAQDEAEVTRAVAAALSVEAQRRDPVGQLGRLLGARGRTLVVLDSVDRALDALPEAVGRWLKLAPEATFLITSRVAPNLLGERTTVLDALPPPAAVALFRDRAGPLTGADAEALVGELCEALEGVPLAVELAAARAKSLPLDALVRDLSVQLLAAEGSDAPARHRSVAASLDWSFGMLSAAARDALCALAAFAGPFPPEAAAAVLGVGSPVDALGLLEELVEASLLRALPGGRRFAVLRLVRMYALGVAAPELARAAERRHGAWYAAGGQPAALAALYRTGGVERLRERIGEVDEIVAACRRAVARGDGAQAVGALRSAWPVLERTGPLPLAVALADGVLGMAALTPAERAAAASAAGSIYGEAGRAEDAARVLTDALTRATGVGDAAEASRLRSLLARGALRSGQPDLAREHADRALAEARAAGDRHAEGAAQRLRGVILRNLGGEFDAAQTAYAEALRVCRELGDRAGEGVVLGNLGLLLENFGFQDEALAAYNLALIIAREVEDARLEATILGNLGLLHAQRGDFEAAREVYGTAIALTRQTGDDRAYAIVLGNLANVDADLGDFAAAQAGYEASLALHQQLGDARFESLILANLGNLFLATGEPAEARKWFLEARALARTAGARRGEALAEINLGKVAAELYEVAAARGHYEVSLALASETGDRRVEAAAWGELGALAVDEGDVAAAQAALATAEGVARGLNEPIRVAMVACVWARLEATRGRLPEARARLAEAEAVAAQLKVGPASDLGREIRATQRALRAI